VTKKYLNDQKLKKIFGTTKKYLKNYRDKKLI